MTSTAQVNVSTLDSNGYVYLFLKFSSQSFRKCMYWTRPYFQENIDNPVAKEVFISGSFNSWQPIPMNLSGGLWSFLLVGTGKSFSEALVLASTNPQYHKRLSIELRVQYMKIPSSEHVKNMLCAQNCFECQNKNKKQFLYTACSWNALSMEFSFTELVVQWTICRHIVGQLI